LPWKKFQSKPSVKGWTYDTEYHLIGDHCVWDIRKAKVIEVYAIPNLLHGPDGFAVFDGPRILVCRKEINKRRNEDAAPGIVAERTAREVAIVPPDAAAPWAFLVNQYFFIIPLVLDSNNTLKINVSVRIP
jgi:hypothetical protein